MYTKLTYLLIAITFLVSSCSSDTIDDITDTTGNELSFNVSNISNLSRSSVTTDINHFVVFGDVKSLANEASAPVFLFNQTRVEYNNGDWRYDGTQYWIPNKEHSFVAISPRTIFDNGNTPRYLNSQLSFDYSIPESGNVADILIATHRRFYVDKGAASTLDNRITLTFSHLLSLINIAPAFNDNGMNRNEYIKFHKLEFSEVSTKARLGILPASRLSDGPTDDMELDITGQESGNYSITFPTPVKVENNAKNVSLFADNDAIIMLPQTFSADSEAKMTFYYTVNEDPTLQEVTLPLKGQIWGSGTSYMYKFTIERFGVKIDSCEINPWNEIQGDKITVD